MELSAGPPSPRNSPLGISPRQTRAYMPSAEGAADQIGMVGSGVTLPAAPLSTSKSTPIATQIPQLMIPTKPAHIPRKPRVARVKSPDVPAPPDVDGVPPRMSPPKTSAVSWGGWSSRTRNRDLGLKAEPYRTRSRVPPDVLAFHGVVHALWDFKKTKNASNFLKPSRIDERSKQTSTKRPAGVPQRRGLCAGGDCARS